jgi:hypothetical protein
MNAFAFRFKSDPATLSPEKLLLRQFLGLLAPVLDLVGAEGHVLVDLGDILVGQLGQLREGDDALFGQILGGDRADALDHGQVVRLALRRLEQRRSDGGLGLGLCLRGSLCLGFLLGLGFLRRGLGLRLGRYVCLGFRRLGFDLGCGLLGRLGATQQDLGDPDRG